ncbi:hypothetical protein ACFU3J_15900 [Streptomyces sp. NPDC057411]|uniref:hypothetical protein n=1 Tax=unclassified Streptomyces TaxID=2593676 RepID=UPI00362B2E09
MAKDDQPRTPQEFRDLLKAGYDYPDEVDAERGRSRRRARRAHRQAERARTAQWIADERRREPISVRAALLVVAVLLGIGVLARFGPDWLTGQDGGADHVTTAPSVAPSAGDDKPPASGTVSPSSAAPSPAADLSDPDKVAEEFARHYLTRNPPEDQDHTAAVGRAAPWATPPLVENLSQSDDPAFERLVSRGGVSTVSTVAVKPAGEKLPPDNPLRVWRTVTAKVDVVGYTTYSETTVLQCELTTFDGAWRVARVLGV